VSDVADIDLEQLPDAQQTAQIRLLLYVGARVHELTHELYTTVERKVRAVASDDGSMPTEGFFGLRDTAESAWAIWWKGYQELLKQAQLHAAAIPYGVLAVQHDTLSAGVAALATEARRGAGVAFAADLDDVIAAANDRVLGGLKLSRRLWELNNGGYEALEQTLLTGIADGQSEVQLSRSLEQYLGAGAECPRWTWQRLRLSKKRIAAGDTTGLLGGSPCSARGVAYNALRLAHTELATVHQLAAARALSRSPWVEAVAIRLSGSHPKPDVCDQHAEGGPNGGGIYPPGDQPVPPYHPNCLCYQAAVLVSPETYRGRLQSYLGGTSDDALDDYRGWLGIEREVLPLLALIPLLALALAGWLSSDPDDMEDLINADPAGA
jgi:hypothetical protein